MKGYAILILLSLAVVLVTPLSAMPSAKTADAVAGTTAVAAESTGATTAPTTAAKPETGASFVVKDTATGTTHTFSETDFLIAVVSCEMAPSSPVEALKAQAVASYTYYCKQRAAAADGVFSNVPETLFTAGTPDGMKQRWGEQYQSWYQTIADAVKAVKGQRILYNGEPITACYHAISAGLTDSAADVWGGNYPYLQPVDSSGDLTADGYETTVTLDTAAVTAALQSLDKSFTPAGDPAAWFASPATTASGMVKTVTVCGKTFSGTRLRTALSLRSACFTVGFADGRFTFTVHGYGHNIGMSQTGAKYMANQGAGYQEILRHYYPGTTVC